VVPVAPVSCGKIPPAEDIGAARIRLKCLPALEGSSAIALSKQFLAQAVVTVERKRFWLQVRQLP